MSTPSVAVPAVRPTTAPAEDVERYAAVRQYSLAQILAVWAAAVLPMAVLAWLVAPALEDNFSGTGNVPMAKALLVCLTVGLIWQFFLVAVLVWREQHTFRWSRLNQGCALAPFAAEPAERPRRRQAVADPDPVDRAVRCRVDAPSRRRAGGQGLRSVSGLGCRSELLERCLGPGSASSFSCRSSTPF